MKLKMDETMRNLTWVRARPTVPGAYWYRKLGEKRAIVVQIEPDRTITRLGNAFEDLPGEWAGPI
ncbi:MAG: hypothetical protein ACT4OO_12900 [Nitrospiraceae bacterium]